MKPYERRQVLLGWLRKRGAVTADEAAARLGVSLRTLHRDIASLRLDGYTIHGEPGRGGGIRLDPAARPPAIEFDADEVIGLYLTTSFVMAAQTVPFSKAAQRALDKLAAALAPARAIELSRLMKRVVVGVPASQNVVESISEVDPRLLPKFEEAFRREKGLRFAYKDRKGKETTRTIEPHGVLIQSPAWYLLAMDTDKDAPRMLRMDRISKPRVLESVDFDPRPFEVFDELIHPAALPDGQGQ